MLYDVHPVHRTLHPIPQTPNSNYKSVTPQTLNPNPKPQIPNPKS